MNEEFNAGIQQQDEEKQVNYVDMFMRYLMYWPWILACLVVSLIVAFFMYKHATPVYKTDASMLIKTNDNQSAFRSSSFAGAISAQDMGMFSMASDFDTEVKVLASRNLIQHVIESLDLYVEQRMETPLRYKDIYGVSPIRVWTTPQGAGKIGLADIDIELKANGSFDVKAKVGPTKATTYEYEKHFDRLPALLSTRYGVVSISRVDSVRMRDCHIRSTITDPELQAKAFSARLSVEPADKKTYVASISFNDPSPLRSIAFINRLVQQYNYEANVDKNVAAEKTSEFINNRIVLISQELGKTEGQMAGFKKRAGLTDLQSDAKITLENRSAYEKRRSDNDTQLRLIQYVKSFINQAGNQNEVIPLNTAVPGQDDGGLSKIIAQYNDLILNRARLIRNSSESSTVIRDMDVQIKGMRNTINQTMASVERSARITQAKLDTEAARYAGQVSSVPEDEKQFLNISRQRDFQSQLYLILMQKREENAIRLAATANNGKLIESPMVSAKVSPKGSIFMLIAMVLGIAFPCLIIYLKQLLAFKIESRADVTNITNLPIIGEIPFDKSVRGERDILIRENQNGLMEEVFRNFRTNLQFHLGGNKRVILVSSTTSGEGKSTISGNLATSLAFLGKKVVIVGLDVRKPGLNKVFHLPIHHTKGITSYLSDPDNTDLMSLVQPSGVSKNLDVLVGGIIPPNPTELVARPSLDKAIEILKQHYEVIIIDTAPLGMMSDTPLIARVADATVYVCRANYTRKASFALINEARDQKKLPNIGIVLNGIDMNSRSSGYYYGYGNYGKYNRYGYGYGRDYGAGYEHTGMSQDKKKNIFEKIFSKK